ncbi:MAG: molecular chaperone HtpG [Clostridiales bacterium]|nr:molecular chaperone HtpG [Clostridiales bacterium]
MSSEKGNISINTENIFPIIKKWLYSDKDIFVRELISNGCDAVSKYKRLISMGEVDDREDQQFKILVTVNKEKKTMTFSDNGIGMTEDEVKKYINEIAFSGAEDFVNKYKDKMGEGNDIIGHFGLGFYSAFMAASKVSIDTLSYKEGAEAVKWVSDGGTEFEISKSDIRTTRGTTITLFINEESEEFLEEYKLRNIISKYCAFMPTEIYLEDECVEKKEDDKSVVSPINDTKPLWIKKPSECTDEEYKEFYKKTFREFEEPLFWIHLNVDYPFNLKGILYFPKLKNEFELVKGEVKLYNNQVFVADNIKEVIPEFLLLLKGAIDCPDLPLNVSRSFLQNDKDVSRISKHIIKKVADKLNYIFKNEREKYNEFWENIQIFIKYGCLREESFYEKIKDSLIFKDINDKYITLNEYLENAKEKHENKVFYVSDTEKQAQYIKLFKEYDLNAVVLNTTIDNNFISFLEYKDSKVKFARVDSDLSDVLKDKESEENKEANDKLIEIFKSVIGDKVKEYKIQGLKKEETPAMVLTSEDSRRMKEMQAQFGGVGMPNLNFNEEKTLVINNNNELVKKVVELNNDEANKDKVDILCKQIFDLALISNQELDAESISEFINRTNKIMMMAL